MTRRWQARSAELPPHHRAGGSVRTAHPERCRWHTGSAAASAPIAIQLTPCALRQSKAGLIYFLEVALSLHLTGGTLTKAGAQKSQTNENYENVKKVGGFISSKIVLKRKDSMKIY